MSVTGLDEQLAWYRGILGSGSLRGNVMTDHTDLLRKALPHLERLAEEEDRNIAEAARMGQPRDKPINALVAEIRAALGIAK